MKELLRIEIQNETLLTKILCGIAFFTFFYPFRFACKYNISTGISRFGTKINHPVGTSYNIRIMFYHQDGMSLFYQCIKRSQQFFYIMKMKTGCGSSKMKRILLLALPFPKKGSQLYPLRFTTG